MFAFVPFALQDGGRDVHHAFLRSGLDVCDTIVNGLLATNENPGLV